MPTPTSDVSRAAARYLQGKPIDERERIIAALEAGELPPEVEALMGEEPPAAPSPR